MKKTITLLSLLPLFFLSACIETDESATFYVSNEGRVEVVLFLDRVVSTSPEPERTKEQTRWLAEFRSHSLDQFKKFKELKAKDVRSLLLRQKPPYSAVIGGTLDSVDSLGKFLDMNSKPDGDTLRFVSDGHTRKMIFQIAGKDTADPARDAAAPTGPLKFPVFKFVPVAGRITETAGCTPSKDQQSCTLDFAWVERMEDAGKGYAVVITWETLRTQ